MDDEYVKQHIEAITNHHFENYGDWEAAGGLHAQLKELIIKYFTIENKMKVNISKYPVDKGPWANMSKDDCLHCNNKTVGYFISSNGVQIRRFCSDPNCQALSLKEIEEISGEKFNQ